jgi:hypothetical protein
MSKGSSQLTQQLAQDHFVQHKSGTEFFHRASPRAGLAPQPNHAFTIFGE